jgi:hypothetical protein
MTKTHASTNNKPMVHKNEERGVSLITNPFFLFLGNDFFFAIYYQLSDEE